VIACATTAPALESVPADVRKRSLDRQFVAIALPALAQCAAEPLAGLVDTAWIGRLGSVAMGAAGVAVSAHYAAAKVFNDPLLRTSISLVASSDGTAEPAERNKAISAALVLSLAVGLLQV
jgi:Na+-driven multidrug efflux pump